jgi:hypothetical protein
MKMGFETDRLKTGTPARVDARSINFSNLEAQPGVCLLIIISACVRAYMCVFVRGKGLCVSMHARANVCVCMYVCVKVC